MTEILVWAGLGLASWLLYLVLRRRCPDFYARSENWTANHPALNAAIFAAVEFPVGLGVILARGHSLGRAVVGGAVGSALVFLLFFLMSVSYSKRYRQTHSDGE